MKGTLFLAGHDGKVLKVNDNSWLMFHGPQGFFDRKACTIHIASYDGTLRDLST